MLDGHEIPVVLRADDAIHANQLIPMDYVARFVKTYPLEIVFHPLINWVQVENHRLTQIKSC